MAINSCSFSLLHFTVTSASEVSLSLHISIVVISTVTNVLTLLLTAYHTLMSCFLSLQTYIGSVVISMNPYRSLPIYTPQKVEEYRNRNFYELSPHM